MSWPSPADYQDVIQSPQICFQTSQLKAGSVALNNQGLPRVMTGNFASVYELRNRSDRWAIRCFLRQVSDQQRRYSSISQHLSGLALPSLLGFAYLHQEIRVRGQLYPIVRMEWAEGKALHTFIEQHLRDPGLLLNLAALWRGLVNSLRGNRIAHGDLQHGNVLVTPQGQMRLVDYDAMYVPALRGEKSPELGHENFQHPKRAAIDYNEQLDNFAALVIYASLRALAADLTLWNQFHTGENLILSAKDYKSPQHSIAFNRLRGSTDTGVQKLATELQQCCGQTLTQVPEFETLVASLPNPTVPPHKSIAQYTPPPVRTYAPPILQPQTKTRAPSVAARPQHLPAPTRPQPPQPSSPTPAYTHPIPPSHYATTRVGKGAALAILVVLGLIGVVWLISSVSQQGGGGIGVPPPPKQPIDVSSIRAAVMSTLDGWVAATKTGNVENCMGFFADRLDNYYSLRNVGSDKVRSDLMKAFSNYSTFDVQLSNVDITPDQNGTTATATFDKSFNFQGPKYYSGRVQQRMWFANQGGRWRIVGLKELQIYSKDSGTVADGSGGATDTSTGSQGTTPQPPTIDANAYRIRQEALARDYWQRADRLLQQRQYSAALDICNQGLAAVPGNNALLQKKNEIERVLSDVAGNGYGQTPPQQPTLKRRSSEDSPQQPTLKRRSSDDSQVSMPAPRPTPPVYQGPRQGVITRPVVIEQNELISVGDELPGVPVIVQSVEPRDQVGIVESPGPSNQWKKLVLRSKKKMHVVISIRWSVL